MLPGLKLNLFEVSLDNDACAYKNPPENSKAQLKCFYK